MAVKIRLKRMGAKKAPHYRKQWLTPGHRGWRFMEEIGYYNPAGPEEIKIDVESKDGLQGAHHRRPGIEEIRYYN